MRALIDRGIRDHRPQFLVRAGGALNAVRSGRLRHGRAEEARDETGAEIGPFRHCGTVRIGRLLRMEQDDKQRLLVAGEHISPGRLGSVVNFFVSEFQLL